MRIVRRIWFWLRRSQLEDELRQEVQQHLEWKAEDMVRQGFSGAKARSSAHLEFGSATLAMERSRMSWGFPSLESILQDVRYGARQLRNHLGFTAVAILTLALGIGANSAMFSFVNAFLLSSLPVKDPQELVKIGNVPHTGFEQKAYEWLRDSNHSLAGLIAWDEGNIAVSIDGNVSIEPVDFLSANAYFLLGVPAYRGRMLSAEDDVVGKPAVAVISYAFWERRFGLDPGVIGKRVQFKDISCTIVGVAPPWFHGLRIGGRAVPITLPAKWHQHLTLKDNTTYDLFGRLAKGVDMKAAQADLDLAYHQELRAEAGTVSDARQKKELVERRIELVPASQSAYAFDQRFALELRLLEAVVGLVLLVACVNLANLLLARGNARQREIGVRLALGAQRSRIVRQLVTENLLLALGGGALGLLLSSGLGRVLLLVLRGETDTAALGIHTDSTVLIFTAGLSLITGLVFGLVPAWRSSSSAVSISAGGDRPGRRGTRIRGNRVLIVPQIALSLVVLVLCGLLLRSLQHLRDVDVGFRHDHLLTFWLMPTLSGYDGERELRLYDDVLAGLNQLPGVRVASMSRWSLLRRGRTRGLDADGTSHPDAKLVMGAVGTRFFETLAVPVLLGRDFTRQDSPASLPVAIINEAAAAKYFPGQNPIGHRVRLSEEPPARERTVVGVVKNVKFSLRGDMPVEAVYIPYAQAPDEDRGQAMIKISAAVDPESLMPLIRSQVKRMAKDLPAIDIAKEDEVLDDETSQERSLSKLLGGFGGLAAGLALLGLYGTVAYSVSRRIREIAIRLALGAQYSGVLRMIVGEAMRFVMMGAAAGVVLAAFASRTLESFLFDVHVFDPPTYLAIVMALSAACLAAAYLPARRALQVDPMVALRHE